MKILHVIPVYEPAWFYGGPVRSVSALCRHLVELGVDVTVYTTTANHGNSFTPNINNYELIGGVKVWRFPNMIEKNFFYSPELSKKLLSTIRQYDLTHITSIWNYPGLPGAQLASKFKVPFMYSARGSLIPEDYPGTRLKNLKKKIYYHLFLKKYFAKAEAMHFTNLQEYETSKSSLPTNLPGVIVPNGIDCSEFDNIIPREVAQAAFVDIPNDATVISYLGRLHARKGLDVLIKAHALISNEFPKAHLVLGGPDFGVQQNLIQLVNELNIADKVHFVGILDSPKRLRLLSMTDIFVLAGFSGENFGMSVVEAMAVGIPVLVSPQVCIHQEIVNAHAGLAVEVDARDIANKIRLLLNSPFERGRMSQAAKLLVREKYDIKNIALSMKYVYEDILNRQHSERCEWVNII